MDSGIDSTESSNGSLEEGGAAAAHVVVAKDLSLEVAMEAGEGTSEDLQAQQNDCPCQALPAGPSAIAPVTSNVRTVVGNESNPCISSLQRLAATVVKSATTQAIENQKGEVEVSVTINNSGSSSSDVINMMKVEFPEGSRLSLHFPIDGGNTNHDRDSCDVEPPPGLTFANVSPSMYLSRGYEAYSQGYAVLPYENNDLQRKLKTLKLKIRQSHLSVKAKERKLRIAASLNNVETVDRLLQEGINPKVTDDKERSALHIAASKGYTEIAKLLLQHGADPNQRDGVGNTPLHLAACTSHIPTVTLLLKAGTNVKQPDNQGYSPLHLARSKLKLLQRDNNASSQDIKKQVCQVIEMMQTYLECSGNSEEAELLESFTNQLSLSDTRQQMENDLQALLNSLNDLSLVKSKAA